MALAAARQDILNDTTLRGSAFCQTYAAKVDEWLIELFAGQAGDTPGLALAATGGYGRGELSPQSDLDVLLLHDGRPDIGAVAEQVWYPIWDEGVKLGHAVRTAKEALTLAETDLDTATSLLSLRHLAGDAQLTGKVSDGARQQWRKRARAFLPELAANIELRHHRVGEVAFLLEPDLKEGRGGLRDVHAIAWAAAAGRVRPETLEDLRQAYETLLAARVELHRVTGRATDRLGLEDQDAVAEALGYPDADVLMSDIAAAARHIAWRSDDTWAALQAGLPRKRIFARRPRSEVIDEVVLAEGMVELVAGTEITPRSVLRLGIAAARNEARIGPATLDQLRGVRLDIAEPWPIELRDDFVALFAEGERAIPVVETLDQLDLFVPFIPEWEPCRSRPQRNAYHRFTVDRHLYETAAEAARLVPTVERPDLLLLGALLHDIGKGYPGDHTEVGQELMVTIATRMGFGPADVDTLVDLVRHHLLLPDVATRRDITDQDTIAAVAKEVRSIQTLELLGALTEADSIATGPSAWSTWKAGLVKDLVVRTTHVLDGGDAGELPRTFPTAEQRERMRRGTVKIMGEGDTLTVMTMDRPGVFSRTAGVLSLNGLDVLEAAAHSEYGMALAMYRVEPDMDRGIGWDKVLPQLQLALQGKLALDARLADRLSTYSGRRTRSAPMRIVEPRVLIDNELSSSATVIEVAAPNGIGLLYRITRTLSQMDLDILRAKVQTLGEDVVDSFYVRDRDGRKVTDRAYLVEIQMALKFAMQPPRSVRTRTGGAR